MLMTKEDALKHMCPFSASREKPFGCRGPGCAAWRRWQSSYGGAVLGYCGMVPHEPTAIDAPGWQPRPATVLTADNSAGDM